MPNTARTRRFYPSLVPPDANLAALPHAAAACKACDLWKNAMQTVFGEGKEGARAMLVGEHPFDHSERLALFEADQLESLNRLKLNGQLRRLRMFEADKSRRDP